MMFEKALLSDAEKPETILGARGNVANSTPRGGEYVRHDVRNFRRRMRNAPMDVREDEFVVRQVERLELRMIFSRSLGRHHLYFLGQFTLSTCRKNRQICPMRR